MMKDDGVIVGTERVSTMTKNEKSIDIVIEYCGAWGGLPEANYVSNLVRTVFPNANVKLISPGRTGNLIVKHEDR